MGQIVDGIAVASIGLVVDKTGVFGNKYPQRKSWHLLGTIFIAISFPFLFSSPPGYIREKENWSDLELVRFYLRFLNIYF
jgi:Na+/melibiose symporter-like transporter